MVYNSADIAAFKNVWGILRTEKQQNDAYYS